MAISNESPFIAAIPFTAWQYVTVTFDLGADVDHVISHSLSTTDPEAVEYIPISKDRAADIYHDQGSTRREWGSGYIVLRSSVADAVVGLLLILKR